MVSGAIAGANLKPRALSGFSVVIYSSMQGLELNISADRVAWLSSVACFWAAIIVAGRLPSKTPRIYWALVLFAMSWALLVPYYEPGAPKTELLASLNGFVAVFVGVQLRREYQERHSLTPIDKWPVYILVIIVLPNSISVWTKGMLIDEQIVPRLEVLIGTLMTILGFISLFEGLRAIYVPDKKKFKQVTYFFGLLLLIYSGVECWYASSYWKNYSPGTPLKMPRHFLVSFAILKILLTGSFLLFIWHRPLTTQAVVPHKSIFDWLVTKYNIFTHGVARPFEEQHSSDSAEISEEEKIKRTKGSDRH